MTDLTTVTSLKAYLGITTLDDDSLLASMITAYSTEVISWLNRDIALTTYTEQLSGDGGRVLMLGNYPIQSITSLTIDGIVIPARPAYGQNGYLFDGDSVVLFGYVFTRDFLNVQITYSAGFTNIPTDLAQAVNEIVALRYRERDRIGNASKTLAGETVAFIVKDFPASAQTILNQYKSVTPL